MSWVKSLPVSGREEDVFDEDASELDIQDREWMKNMKRRLRDGFVDGADAGEDGALEAGFNMGLKEGAALTVGVGRLKGIISAIWCWCQLQNPQDPIPPSVADLLKSIMQHEDTIVDGLRRNYEKPPPSESDVTESIGDMELNEGGPGCCGDGCKETGCCKEGEHMDMEVDQGGTGSCEGGSKETGCYKEREHKDQDAPHQARNLCFGSAENLNRLLQRCMDLVVELGLPQELIGHIQEMKTMN